MKTPAGNITKEELLLDRGWSEDSIRYLAGSSHLDKNKKQVWFKNTIEKIEKTIVFKNFTTGQEFKNRDKSLVNGFEVTAQKGMDLVTSLDIDFTKNNHLFAKIKNYDVSKPIVHLVKNDFIPDENGSYSLFTDGSFKTLNNKAFASCGGWIMDNKTQEVIVEFSKPIALDETRERSMPKFELIGIIEGAKLVNLLKLRNVQFYTDEATEARKVFEKIHNIETLTDNNYEELYIDIAKILKNSNSSISWIPRQYNHHADEMSEISLNAWIKDNEGDYKNKDYISENGYKVDREKTIYFYQNKAEFKEYNELKNPLTLIVTNHNIGKTKYMVSLIHDSRINKLSFVEALPREFSYIEDSLPEEIKNIKKVKIDGINLMYLTRAINSAEKYGNINICVSPFVTAVNNKVIPIPSELQEEFFEFHKALNEYPREITMTDKSSKLNDKIKNYLQEIEKQFIIAPILNNKVNFS